MDEEVVEVGDFVMDDAADYFLTQDLQRRLDQALLRVGQLEKIIGEGANMSFLQKHFDKLLCEAINENRVDTVRAILERPDFDPLFSLNAVSIAYHKENFRILRELLLFKTVREAVQKGHPELDMSGTLGIMESDRLREVIEPTVRAFRKDGSVNKEMFYKINHRDLTMNRHVNNEVGNRESYREALECDFLGSLRVNV